MGLSSELSCGAGSFSHSCNPHRFFQSGILRLYFPTLEPLFVQSVSLPSCSSWFTCTQMWHRPALQLSPRNPSATTLPALVLQALPCHQSSPPRLPISAPSTGLYECFFFNFLDVGFPYGSIFWQFWLFLVFKFFVVLLLVVRGGTVLPPSWLELLFMNFLKSQNSFQGILI